MAYILLDESGDLGFSFDRGSTKFFVVTLIFTEQKKKLQRIAKKIFRSLRKKDKKRGSLHAYHEDPATRQRLLRELQETDCKVFVIILNKQRVYTKLKDQKAVLYNFVTNILLDRLFTKKPFNMPEEVTLLASKRETNVFINENFKSYLATQVSGNHKIKIAVDIARHDQDGSLQVTDFVSWAIFRKVEHGDDSYYNMIKHLIVEESPLFP